MSASDYKSVDKKSLWLCPEKNCEKRIQVVKG